MKTVLALSLILMIFFFGFGCENFLKDYEKERRNINHKKINVNTDTTINTIIINDTITGVNDKSEVVQ